MHRYSDKELIDALKKASTDGVSGPEYETYLKSHNRPSAIAIRQRFGTWNAAVRKAGLIPAGRRTEAELKTLIKLGKMSASYLAHRKGVSAHELKVSMGLEKKRKPTKERYIDEGVRIARKLGRPPAFYDFNRHSQTVSAWNPWRYYHKDWSAFTRDIEAELKHRLKSAGGKSPGKAGAPKARKPKLKTKGKDM
ncbi:MAG: homing endonuclease associated repeat-containing protein [Thermoleophilia bacterium]|jgi:hypothetical protein